MYSRVLLLLCVFLCISFISSQDMNGVDADEMSLLELNDWEQTHSPGVMQFGPMIRDMEANDMDKIEDEWHLDKEKDAMAESDSLSADEEEHLMDIVGGDLSKLRHIKLKLRGLPRSHRLGRHQHEGMSAVARLILRMKLLRLKCKLKLLKMLDALCAADKGSRIWYRGKVVGPRALERHFLESVLSHKLLLRMLMSMKIRGGMYSPLALKLREMKAKVGKAPLLYAPSRLNAHLNLHADSAVVNVGTTFAKSRARNVDDRVTLNTAAERTPTLRDRTGPTIRRCLRVAGRLICPPTQHRFHTLPLSMQRASAHAEDNEEVKHTVAATEHPLRMMESMQVHAPVIRELNYEH